MDNEQVCNSAQPLQRVLLVRDDRLIADIPAGGDHGETEVPHQQVMQRRIGQQGAEPGIAWRHCGSNGSADPPQQDNGPCWSGQQSFLGRPDTATYRDICQRGKHHRKGLFLTSLARPKTPHGGLVARVDDEMKATDSLHCDDRSGAQCRRHGSQCVVAAAERCSRCVPQRNTRAAVGAGIGLGVEAPVGRIVVFRAAGRTHRKAPHRGPRPIVWNVFDDTVARPAMRTVDERVAVAAVRRIEELGKTIGAGREVRQHLGGRRARRIARPDFEPIIPARCDRARFDGIDRRIGRRAFTDVAHQRGDPLGIALGLDHDPLARIDDPARKPEQRRLAVDEGPEPDTLHGAAYEDAQSYSLDRPGVVR